MSNKIDETLLLFTSKFIKQKQYWINKLSGEIAPTEILFPHENKYRINTDSTWKSVDICFPPQVCRELMKISKKSDLSLYIVLLAALKLLIRKYSQNPDITVLSPINKFKISEETMNHLVLIRDHLENNISFKELILHIRQSVLEAYANQDYPFDNLCEFLFDQPFRSPEQINHFISGIVYSLENIHNRDNIEKLKGKLHFSFLRENSDIKGHITYDGNSYEEVHLKQISRHYLSLLEQALLDVNRPCAAIYFLSEEERKQLIVDFNNNNTDFPGDKTIYHFIERYAVVTPDAPAVTMEGEELTYSQLNQKANQLARGLLARGIKQDQTAGIMLDRSPLMMVCILAVWKTGGAYIPIDPLSPLNRKYGILNDSASIVLLTYWKYVEQSEHLLARSYKGTIIPLDKEESTTGRESTTNLDLKTDMHSLAYVIYTSGSTGKPKGAMVEHIGMMNHIHAKINDLKITGKSVVAQNASHTFDISVWQMFAGLVPGGRTVIYPDQVIHNAHRFISQITADKITILEVVPSYLSVILEDLALNSRAFDFLEYLLVTGEIVKPDLLRRWFEKYPAIKVVNAYGPTEASDDITHHMMEEAPDFHDVPIGQSLQNLNIYIVGEDMNLCPLGVKGEIWVSGVGVGRGYLNDMEKTRQVFIRDPFARDTFNRKKGVRLYKTGDIGCWLANGVIKFFGRKDHQLKIRGYRIELGEIESRLVSHPSVKEAAVIDKEDRQGNIYLCAYLVTHNETGVVKIKEYLSQYLPDYMLPTQFVELEQMPLTPNGKVDRKALPDIEVSAETQYIAPQNAIEKILAEIMANVLGIKTIGINENFFELGGDSIKAIQIASRLYKAGYKIEMRDIFESPLISDLAPRVAKLEHIADQAEIIGSIPLTPIQREFFQKISTGRHHYNQAVMLFSKSGFQEEATSKVFKKIQEHHDALRMSFTGGNGEIIQVNRGLEVPLSLQVWDFRGSASRDKALNLLKTKAEEIQAGIDLETGPLMKLGLFHMDDGDRLLIVIHHLVVDGVSWRILFEDIETLYQQYRNHESLVLPLKTDSYKIWSENLCQYANSELFPEKNDHWRVLETQQEPGIPGDFSLESNLVKDEAVLSFKLTREETHRLLTKVNEPFATDVTEILLTALGLAVKESHQQNRILVALEAHGREEILENVNITRTVGWFTSIYPVLLDFTYSDNLSRQIIEIKENLRQVPQRGIGYGILKYLTKPEHKKEVVFNLIPGISFNYLGQFDADIEQRFFEISRESVGNTRCSDARREFDIEINGGVTEGELSISIAYNKKQYKAVTIEGLMDHYHSQLTRVISYCCQLEEPVLTPSDLTYKKLSINDLEKIKKGYEDYIVEDVYTLSSMQEGMYFHTLYDKYSLAYFQQMSNRLYGDLNIAVVERSLNQLLKRHDILRTVFIQKPGDRLLQVVLEKREINFFYDDISKREREENESLLAQFKERDKHISFDLSQDVLMRVAVFKLDNEEYEFIWSFHGILMDGWCLAILIMELFEIYFSIMENRPYQLPEVNQYRTFIQWLENRDKQAAKEYWEQYLHQYNEYAFMPNRKTHLFQGKEISYQQQLIFYRLDKEKTRQFYQIAAKYNVTINAVIRTMWGIILGIYNDKHDVVFGAVVSGRPAEIEGVETIVGLFINTIPVRVRYEPDTRFTVLLQQVQQDVVESEAYQYYPLAKIQANHRLKQNLFDNIITFENYPLREQLADAFGESKENKNLTVSNIEIFEQINYDFSFQVYPEEQLTFKLDYNADVFENSFMKKVADHIGFMINQVLTDENSQISQYSLLEEDEKNRIHSGLKEDMNDIDVEFNL